MRFGLFCLMPQRDPQKDVQQIAADAAEQARMAEQMDFEAVWFAEHHFSNYSVIPSPLLMAAYCAGQTSRINVGTGVLVLPLYEPTRLIEEIAFVDQISNGRLYLGIGSGYQDYEFSRFGRNLADSQEAFVEFLDMIETSFSTGELSFEGKHFKVPEAPLASMPKDRRMPKVFVAGLAQNQAVQERLAKSGYVPFLAHHHRSAASLIEPKKRIQNHWRAAGRDAKRMPFATQRFVFVTKNRKEAEEAAEHIRYTMRIALGLRFNTAKLVGPILQEAPAAGEPSIEEILEHAPIGAPELVAERLSEDIRTLGPSHLSCMIQFGGLSQSKAMRSLELLGSEVMSILKSELGDLESINAGVYTDQQPLARVG